MRVRKVIDGQRQFGHGQADFWHDQPEAVAQIVGSRLGLWTGQWFLAISAGTPWSTRVLGYSTRSTRDIAIEAQILGTPGMATTNPFTDYSSSFDPNRRKWSVSAKLNTIYGQIPFKGVS